MNYLKSEFLLKAAESGIKSLYSHVTQTTETAIDFIDPLCAMLKLCVLNFKNIGTKISIKYNVIDIQEAGILQGCQRFINNDERDDLHQLKLPILYFKALENGFIENENKISKDNLLKIKLYAIMGLKKLRETYDTTKKTGSMIKQCIDDYVRILNTEYKYDTYDAEIKLIDKSETFFVLYSNFYKLWNKEDIDIIMNLFNYIDEKKNNIICNKIAMSIDQLIQSKDMEINSIRP